ncbi:Cullin-2 [Hypsibius exemplaris]|uniref:Cullin-2 n=1 Tax=Hypsibius exemplaris TaxID=2072580 RepID=A0A1W0XBR1_HYPEX|nr:Cullin-2 [Hypsibius exemplaris]
MSSDLVIITHIFVVFFLVIRRTAVIFTGDLRCNSSMNVPGMGMDKSLGMSEDKMDLYSMDERFEERWQRIQVILMDILAQKEIHRRVWNERFSDVYDITVNFPQAFVDRLYENIRALFGGHIQRHVVCSLQKSLTYGANVQLLDAYLQHWNSFYEALKFINKLVMHLNSAVVRPAKINDSEFPMIHLGISLPDYSNEKIEVLELGCQMWASDVVMPLREDMTRMLLDLIQRDREHHDLAYTDPIRAVVASLVAVDEFKGRSMLKTYKEIFETPYIQATGENYRLEASKFVNETTCSGYVEKVLNRLNEEDFRARRLCHTSTLDKVKAEIQARMVNDRLAFILQDSRMVIEERRQQDLCNLYAVLRPSSEGINTLRLHFTSFVEEKAREAVGSNYAIEPQDLVENLVKILARFDEMVTQVFSSDPMFRKAVEDAIRIVINQQSGATSFFVSAELIARYCDTLLRKSSKNLTEVEEKLDGAIKVFRFLDDKDVFQRFYSRMMAKRLINKQFISADVETQVVNKLRDACGCDYTGKLMRMQRDINSSQGMMDKFFEKFPLKQFRAKCDVFINILTSGVWPIPTFDIPMKLPVILQPVIDNFNTFYHSEYSGRRLTWIFQLGSVDVRLNFVKRPVMATMNAQQLAICLAFSDTDTVSLSEMKEVTGMADEYLETNVDCLVSAGILRRQESASILSLNMEYAPKKPRIKILAPVTKEQPQQEKEETEKSTGDMRLVFLQATVCRVMKAHLNMNHATLVKAVKEQTQTRFIPNEVMIKKTIDVLLEKEYIRRSLTAQDVYEYIV